MGGAQNWEFQHLTSKTRKRFGTEPVKGEPLAHFFQ